MVTATKPRAGKATRRELATPTDLEAEGVSEITETVNRLIADAYVLYVKTKNFHWHIAGSHFRGYHLLFDEHADAIFAGIDPMAERIRKIGGTTIRSIGHIARLQTLSDDDDEFVDAQEMVLRLLNDNKQMAVALREATELTEEHRDFPTNDLLQGLLDEAEKRIWFLHELSVGGKNEL